MTQLNNIPGKKLEELVTFPVLIPVKAVSHKQVAQDEFVAALVDVTALHVPGFHIDLVTVRASSSGNYYSATLSITFDTIEQVHAVDVALRAHPLVQMLL
ncbi:Protein of unknown function [Andreprevotia lacus DSM 23236]|jgi:putative lipoic acid-binding regulatory protein|uniref:Uncharacterized protein n=1 Tax=Andreprevotia lacus DSM 23236 TaxID=1121001 RepID=A0A1W1XX53_9NEIS|nr:DUF493 domain-containing protein [Andreprevotia lacus]SMC28523.1 Protein of unknown function [Andreprevotia lacus DSM 23236]